MDGLNHQISRFSRRVRIGLFALLGVITLTTLFTLTLENGFVWLSVDGINLGVFLENGDVLDTGRNSAQTDILSEEIEDDLGLPTLFLFLMTVSFYGLLIFQLERLFAFYQRGEIFSQGNAQRIRNIGLLFSAAAVISILDDFFQIYAMKKFMAASSDTMPGNGWDVVQEINLPLPYLLSGLAIVLIARVMEKGAQQQEELEHVI